jgi:hypothetical protein
MSEVTAVIMAGLGTRWSNGAIHVLRDKMREAGHKVEEGSYSEYVEFADLLRNDPAKHKLIIGHSLGANMTCQVARLAGVPIAAIFAFDLADNAAAMAGVYRMTPVPQNVKLAVAYISQVPGLGGGSFTAENPDKTEVDNIPVPQGHGSVEDEIERHMEVLAFADRLKSI